MDKEVKSAPFVGDAEGKPEERTPRVRELLAFAFPSLPHAFVIMPLNIVIPTFYAAHTSVTLAQIAVLTSFTRIFDAILDPLTGYLSDRTRSPLGRRKPWVLAGGLLCSVAIFFLFQPPSSANFAYYGFWSFAVYFGFTLFEIPRSAWSVEISRDYNQRSRISTYSAGFSVAGSLVFWVMPLLLFQMTGTTEITGTSLSAIAFLYATLMPLGIGIAIIAVRNGVKASEGNPTIGSLIRALRDNKPLWIYAAAIALWGLAQGAYMSTLLIFLSDYMKLGSIFPFLMVMFFFIQIGSMPIWYRIMSRIGKHRAWAIGVVIEIMLRPAILLFEPGSSAMVPMFLLGAVSAFLNTPANIAPGAALGDIVDYGQMKTGVNNAGNFFALNTLMIKATMASGTGLAFGLLGFAGYSVGKPNGDVANFGLITCYLILPAILNLCSAALIWRFPLTARRHSTIRRRIERRAAIPFASPDIDPPVA